MAEENKRFGQFNAVELVLNHEFRRIVRQSMPEEEELNSLIRQYPEQKKKFLLAARIVRGLTTETVSEEKELKEKIWEKIQRDSKRFFIYKIARIAAVFICLVGLGTTLFFWRQTDSSIMKFVNGTSANYIETQLILPNGKKVPIKSNAAIIKNTSNGSIVSINNQSCTYASGKTDGFTQLIVPYGKRNCVILADGSKVWINSGSRLVYPVHFDSNKREVFLDGEAYFDVSKNPQKPFIVRTNKFNIQVLGTQFNVQCYEEEKVFNAVLVRGKVSLWKNQRFFARKVVLAPSQMAIVAENQNKIDVRTVSDVQSYVSWVQGYVNFTDERTDLLLKKISRYYNVKIDLSNCSTDSHISGKLDLKDDPDRVIEGIATIAKLKYIKEGGKYAFYK